MKFIEYFKKYSMNFSTIDNAFGYFPSRSKKRWSMRKLMKLLYDLRQLDQHGNIRGWEHLTGHFDIVIRDLLLIVNGDKRYPPRGTEEDLRIPQDLSTDLYNRIKMHL